MYYNNETIAFSDGQWIKAKEAQATLYNQTMHYGNGVFEGIRSYHTKFGTRIFKAEEHYKRLLYSANRMGIQVPYSVEELTEITYILLKNNDMSDAYIRPLVWCAPNMALTTPAETHLFMCAWKWGKLLGDKLVRVRTSSFCRPHPKSCFVDAKVCGHYTNSILATTEAKAEGFDEALLLDTDGYVAEGSGANFFYEKDGVLYTPPTGNILPGITRRTVLDLCKKMGLRVEKDRFFAEQVYGADSAFLVGTAADVTGLESLDGHAFKRPWESTIGAILQKAYLQMARHEAFTEVYL
jgi:branched-chain amino acid aminotransferase